MFTEGVAARQLGCALANTRSLSVSALGTVCHLLEAERGNPRILLISARYPHYFPPSFGPFFFLSTTFSSATFLPSSSRSQGDPFFPFFFRPHSFDESAPARIKRDRDDGSSSRGW